MSLIKSANGINIASLARFSGVLKNGVYSKNGIINTKPYSLQFDGNNDFIDLSASISGLDFNAPASISFWVKLTGSHKTTGGCIFALSDNFTPFFTVGFGSFSGVWVNEVLSVRYISDAQSVNNGVAFIDSSDTYGGNWYHCVATCSGSAWVLYLNSVSKTLTNYNSNTGKYGDSLTALKASIGNLIRSGGNVLHFPGYIDQFSIWNKVLSAAEVSELYALKPASLPDYSTLSFWANRVIWLPIGETPDVYNGTGGIVDSVGSNHGTMNNFSVGGSFSTDVAT